MQPKYNIQEWLKFIEKYEVSDKDINYLRGVIIEQELKLQDQLKNLGAIYYDFKYTM